MFAPSKFIIGKSVRVVVVVGVLWCYQPRRGKAYLWHRKSARDILKRKINKRREKGYA